MKFMVMLIIVLLAAIILLVFASDFIFMTREKTDLEVCKFSVIINSKIKGVSLSTMEDTPVQCPATVYEHDEDFTKYNDIYYILEQMDNCWYKAGAGELGVFGHIFTEGESYCIVCSEFTTNNDIVRSELQTNLNIRKSRWAKGKKVGEYLSFREKNYGLNIFDKSGEVDGNIYKSTEKEKNNYLAVYRRETNSGFADLVRKVFPVFGTESQTVFISHEEGLSRINKALDCDQVLWQKLQVIV